MDTDRPVLARLTHCQAPDPVAEFAVVAVRSRRDGGWGMGVTGAPSTRTGGRR